MTCPVCGQWAPPAQVKPDGSVVGFHYGSGQRDCWTGGLGVEFVKGVAEILSEDPRLPERAHP